MKEVRGKNRLPHPKPSGLEIFIQFAWSKSVGVVHLGIHEMQDNNECEPRHVPSQAAADWVELAHGVLTFSACITANYMFSSSEKFSLFI